MKQMKQINTNHIFRFPKSCPYCQSDLIGSADAWEQNDNGEWKATNLDIHCDNEPEPDLSENNESWKSVWNEFASTHTYLVYEYWHPAVDACLDAVNSKYVFKMLCLLCVVFYSML